MTYAEQLRQAARDRRRRMGLIVSPPVVPAAMVGRKPLFPFTSMNMTYRHSPASWFGDLRGRTHRPLSATIIRQVADRHGLSPDCMRSDLRNARYVRARQEAMWRLRRETALSLPAIGRVFNRDHTTVLHGIRQHQKRIDRGEA